MVLLLFTATYPYSPGSEANFLDVEIHHLVRAFDRVILVPRNIRSGQLPLPKEVEIDESYTSFVNNTSKLSIAWLVLQSPYFYREIVSRPAILLYPSAMLRLAAFIGGARLTFLWVEKWMRENRGCPRDLLFYTYWFDQAAMGIGLLKEKRFPEIRLVSRVHGYDLYEEYYYKFAFWPCRRYALSLVDRLFPDAQAGTDYLKKRYPDYTSKYETALLGVPAPGFLNKPSHDGVFRIVSCSMIRPEKRIEHLLSGIKRAAELRPAQQFEWYHIGNGEQRNQLQQMADRIFPPNAKAYLPGYSGKEALMHFYRDTPLDVFVNVSVTEGTPVAAMEAISCGLPVIASGVGGNQEIATPENGIQLSPSAPPDEIAEALFNLIDHSSATARKRKGSLEIWEQKYNADRNFSEFVQALRKIRDTG